MNYYKLLLNMSSQDYTRSTDKFKEDLMPMCRCKRGFKAIYICVDLKCKAKDQLQYCTECYEQDDSIHNHKTVTASKKTDDLYKDWSTNVFEKASSFHDDFISKLESIEPILKELDQLEQENCPPMNRKNLY